MHQLEPLRMALSTGGHRAETTCDMQAGLQDALAGERPQICTTLMHWQLGRARNQCLNHLRHCLPRSALPPALSTRRSLLPVDFLCCRGPHRCSGPAHVRPQWGHPPPPTSRSPPHTVSWSPPSPDKHRNRPPHSRRTTLTGLREVRKVATSPGSAPLRAAREGGT